MKDEYSYAYGKNSHIPARRYSYNSRLEMLRRSLAGDGLVLDVGSATGDYAIDLWNDGCDIICCDIDSESLKTLRTKQRSLDAVKGDAAGLPFMDEAFRTIISLNAFRYFLDGLESLREFHRILKPNGLLVLLDHNRLCPDSLILTNDVVRYYTLAEMREMLNKTGYKILAEEFVFVPPTWIPANTVNAVSRCMNRLGAFCISTVYPEFLIRAARRE